LEELGECTAAGVEPDAGSVLGTAGDAVAKPDGFVEESRTGWTIGFFSRIFMSHLLVLRRRQKLLHHYAAQRPKRSLTICFRKNRPKPIQHDPLRRLSRLDLFEHRSMALLLHSNYNTIHTNLRASKKQEPILTETLYRVDSVPNHGYCDCIG
jgi:hypothetical protein